MAGKAKDPLEYGKYAAPKKAAPKVQSLEDQAMDRWEAITKKRHETWKKFSEGGLGNLPLKDIQYPPNQIYEKDPVIAKWMEQKYGRRDLARVERIKNARTKLAPVQEAPYVKQVLGTSRRAEKVLADYGALEPKYRSAIGKAVHEAKAEGKPLRTQAAEALKLVRKLGRKVPK